MPTTTAMMIKNITILGLILLTSISMFMRLEKFQGTVSGRESLPNALEIHSVVADYSRAVLDQDQDLLEKVMHPTASKSEYVRFPPRMGYGFHSYDRDQFAEAPRFSAAEWDVDPADDQIEVLASTEMTATASLSGAWGTEFLHLLRVQNGWQIIQVLGIDPGAEADSEFSRVKVGVNF